MAQATHWCVITQKKDAYETHALIADILGIGGGKLFVKDGLVGGAFYTLGDVLSGDTILICEGYATGASIFESLGSIYPVIIAFNADNMVKCARLLSARCIQSIA